MELFIESRHFPFKFCGHLPMKMMEPCVRGLPATASIHSFVSMTLETNEELTVVLITADGTIVDAHASCKDALGWNREELPGRDIGDLLQSERGLLIAQVLQLADSEDSPDGHTSFSMRIVAQRQDQITFPARVVVRRFAQMDCWTVAFYQVSPQDEGEMLPEVRLEGIDVPMLVGSGGGCLEDAVPSTANTPMPSGWSNTRLLTRPKAAPQPFIPSPTAIQQQAPQFEVPDTIFTKKPLPLQDNTECAPLPEAAAPVETLNFFEESTETVESAGSETAAAIPVPEPQLAPEALPFRPPEKAGPSVDATELEKERAERRWLEQRVAFLTAQVGSLHLELSEHLDEQARDQKKISALEDQLRETRELLAESKAEIARQKNAVSKEELEAARTLNTRLQEQVAAAKSLNEALQRSQVELESQLQGSHKELAQARDALADETSKRQELERKLASAEQSRSDYEQKSRLELSKLESALKTKELELKQFEVTQAQNVSQGKA